MKSLLLAEAAEKSALFTNFGTFGMVFLYALMVLAIIGIIVFIALMVQVARGKVNVGRRPRD